MYKFGGTQTRTSVVGLFYYVLRYPSSFQLTKNVISFLMVQDGSHHICFPDNRVEEERGKEVPKLFFKKFLGAIMWHFCLYCVHQNWVTCPCPSVNEDGK